MKSKRIAWVFFLLITLISHLSYADDSEESELDAYLLYHGFFITPRDNPPNNQGYMTNAQKQQFSEQLSLHPDIKTILEIGLNGGHSAYHLMLSCSDFEKFVSFDLEQHKYTSYAVNFLQQKYGERFAFIKGDSAVTVPAYHSMYPKQTFDLIYIDGTHEYSGCLANVINCKQFAHQNTLVWIDDYFAPAIQKALSSLRNQGFIELGQVFTSDDPCGGRRWIQIRYK